MVFGFFKKYKNSLDKHRNFIEAIKDKNYLSKLDNEELVFISKTINQIIPIIEDIIEKNENINDETKVEEIKKLKEIINLVKRIENIDDKISNFLILVEDIKKYNFTNIEILFQKFEQLSLKASKKLGF